MKTIGSLICTALLAGCSSLPTCGSAEAQGATSCTAGFASTLNEFNATQPAPRNYFTNPYVGPAVSQTAQPYAAPEQYQTIMVNTPQGIVYKRCKVLNGQVVACF